MFVPLGDWGEGKREDALDDRSRRGKGGLAFCSSHHLHLLIFYLLFSLNFYFDEMLVRASAEERVCVLRLMNQFDEFKFFIHNKQKQVADPN